MKPPDPRISTVPTSRAASVGQGPPPPRPCCPAPSLQSAGLCPPPTPQQARRAVSPDEEAEDGVKRRLGARGTAETLSAS